MIRALSLLAALLLGLRLAAEPLANGSFESGLTGFWSNAPDVVRIDGTRAAQGLSSVAIPTREGGAACIYTVLPGSAPDTVYRLTFQAATDAPGQVVAESQVMISADTPSGFWTAARPNGAANGDIAATWTPGEAWGRCELTIGPVPERFMGRPVRRIGVFLRAAGTPGHTLWIDDLKLEVTGRQVAPAAAPTVSTGALAIQLPSVVQIFTQTVPVAVIGAPPEGGRLVCTVSDSAGRAIAIHEAKQGPLAFELTTPGYYQLQARREDKGGTADAEAATSLVITTPLPDDYYTTPLPAFGVWGLDRELLRLGGAKWTRQLSWQMFEERKGPLPAIPPDAEALAARPPWKVIRELNLLSPFKRMEPLPKDQWPDVSAYLRRTVTRHRGLVDVWETQNEPMVGENFHGTMHDAFDLMKLAADAAHEVDPGVPVAGICINPMTPGQYAQIVRYYRELGAAGLLDAVVLHPYTAMAQSPDVSDLVGVLNRLEGELRQAAGREVPLYISEIGYSTQPAGEVTEEQQAAYMARTMFFTAQVPALRATVWHIGYYQAGKRTREGNFSLMRYEDGKPAGFRQPKPAYAAWATASRQLYDATFRRTVELGANRVGLLYERRGKPLLVAYTRDDSAVPTRLLVSAPEVTLTAMCGERQTVPTTDGVLELELSGAPVYIEGAATGLFDEQALAVCFTPEALALLPGGSTALEVLFQPLAGLPNATVVAEAPPGWVAEASRDGGRIAVTVTAPAEAPPGQAPMFVKILDGSRIRYAWQRLVTVRPPLVLSQVVPAALRGGELGLRFEVEPPRLPVVLRVLEGERTVGLARLPGKTRAEIPLFQTTAGRSIPLTAELTTDGGYRWRQPLGLPAAFAVAKRSIRADGELGDWDGAAWYPVGDAADAIAYGRLACAWNRDGLCLAVDVTDTTPHPGKPDGSMFNGDGLQIGVSVEQSAMERPNNIGIQETAYAELGITGGERAASWVWASMNRNTLPLGAAIPGLEATAKATGDRVVYELLVPWRTLGIKRPGEGDTIRLSLLLNDRTDHGRRWAEWYGGIASGKDPLAYGLGLLTD